MRAFSETGWLYPTVLRYPTQCKRAIAPRGSSPGSGLPHALRGACENVRGRRVILSLASPSSRTRAALDLLTLPIFSASSTTPVSALSSDLLALPHVFSTTPLEEHQLWQKSGNSIEQPCSRRGLTPAHYRHTMLTSFSWDSLCSFPLGLTVHAAYGIFTCISSHISSLGVSFLLFTSLLPLFFVYSRF